MNDMLEELQEMKREVDSAKIEEAQNKGKIDEKLKSISATFGVDTIKDINSKLKTMRSELLKSKKVINEKYTSLIEKYNEAKGEG